MTGQQSGKKNIICITAIKIVIRDPWFDTALAKILTQAMELLALELTG